ncbi:hypothetical protein [Sphingomonas sp.]|jgi:hypothetical protein|uniref:hypothetical protein n=1 Tax=Sphingomonas sp. TaxID=28214 RepID=UPI0026024617|nr:hypothetical protein [Sphingomonas sp.]MDF2494617.1 hypothetical protein [Sphingomonas sp.]
MAAEHLQHARQADATTELVLGKAPDPLPTPISTDSSSQPQDNVTAKRASPGRVEVYGLHEPN